MTLSVSDGAASKTAASCARRFIEEATETLMRLKGHVVPRPAGSTSAAARSTTA